MLSPSEQVKLQQLIRDHSRADHEARGLRHVVASLERCWDAVSRAETGRGRSQSPAGGMSSESVADSHRCLPPELFDELSTKLGLLSFARLEYVKAANDRLVDATVLERARQRCESLVHSLDGMYTNAKWKPGAKHTYECPIKFADQTAQLKKKLLDAYQERRTVEEALSQQTRCIEGLLVEIDGFKSIEKELFDARTEVRIKQSELKAVEEEISSLHRLLSRKRLMLGRQEKIDVKQHVRQLEADKRVVQKRLAGHQDQVRVNEQAIRHRALTIAKLEQKVEALADVLGGSEGAAAERVEAELVDELQVTIEQLSRQTAEQQQTMDQLDADIEDLHARARALEKATLGAQEEEAKIRREHKRMRGMIEKELSAQLGATNAALEALQGEISVLREKSNERSKSQRSATSAAE